MGFHRLQPVLSGLFIGSLGTETKDRKRSNPAKKWPGLFSHKPGHSVNVYKSNPVDQAPASWPSSASGILRLRRSTISSGDATQIDE